MLSRALRAAVLDRKAFTEAFFDDDAVADGAIVVALVGGVVYLGRLAFHGGFAFFSVGGLLQSLIGSVASWLILAFATWFAASRLFGSTNQPQTMIGQHGLAPLPLVLEIFGGLAGAVALIWYLVILVVATREAADLPLRPAVVSVLIGFAAAAIIRALLGLPFAVLGALF